MSHRPGPVGAPDHLYGDVPGPASAPRSREELESALRGARRSLRVGLVAVVVGVAATLLSPVRVAVVLGIVAALFGFLVLVVAGIQAAVLRTALVELSGRRDAEEE